MGFNADKMVDLGNGIFACAGAYESAKSGTTQYALQFGYTQLTSKDNQRKFDYDNSIFIKEEFLVGERGKAIRNFLRTVFDKIDAGTESELQIAQKRQAVADKQTERTIRNNKETLDDIVEVYGNVYSDYPPKKQTEYDNALKVLRKLAPDVAKEYEPSEE